MDCYTNKVTLGVLFSESYCWAMGNVSGITALNLSSARFIPMHYSYNHRLGSSTSIRSPLDDLHTGKIRYQHP